MTTRSSLTFLKLNPSCICLLISLTPNVSSSKWTSLIKLTPLASGSITLRTVGRSGLRNWNGITKIRRVASRQAVRRSGQETRLSGSWEGLEGLVRGQGIRVMMVGNWRFSTSPKKSLTKNPKNSHLDSREVLWILVFFINNPAQLLRLREAHDAVSDGYLLLEGVHTNL